MKNKNQKTNELNCRKHIANVVGADVPVRPQKQNGITLIALVITIIVMLILVGVTVSIAINGGLFEMARKAKSQTEEARYVEQELANGRILVGDTWYDSMSDYVNGNRSKDQSEGGTYFTADKNEDGTLKANATYESGGYTATIPAGFKVSEVAGEDKIETGLVIKDKNGNEFVWIPVTGEVVNPYKTTINDVIYSEPTKLTDIDNASKAAYDSQEILNYYYGNDYYKYDENAYETEYVEMVKQVNKYDGFYIGRYETTIDKNNNIGSKYNTPVLSSATKLDETHQYRWYGLYYSSKNADVTGNKADVQTAMIYGQLWDKTIEFVEKQREKGNTKYTVNIKTETWHQGEEYGIKNSGQANKGDVALNIYDLESNGWEWTQEAENLNYRVGHGR